MKVKLYVCFLLVALLVTCSSLKEFKRYEIKKGEFQASLNETGELHAVKSRIITIPYIGWKYGGRMKITELRDHGDDVAEGDSIAQIDQSGVMKVLAEKENTLEIERANLNKLYAEQKSRLKQLQTELASTKAALNMSKVQLEKHQFESSNKQVIKKLELERAEVEYDKVQQQLKLTDIVLENELKIQKLKIVQLEADLADAKEALAQLTVFSPLKGIMQLMENGRSGQMIKVGDELYQGEKFACVPDLSEMKVETTVNETDIAKIDLEQKVAVRLDAFPNRPFQGRIIEIGRLSYKKDEKSRTKIFDVIVLLDESDPVLKPGMTVRCEIQYAQLQNVLYVENDCILGKDGKYYLFMDNGGDCEKCCIRIGPRNNQFTVIYGEIHPGQKVLPLDKVSEQLQIAAL